MHGRIRMRLTQGYSIEEQSETLSIDEAEEILKTKKQFRYTSAERNEDNKTAGLIRHQWCCPYCGKHVPAYHRSFGFPPLMEKIPAGRVEEWAAAQTSLFPTERPVLRLQVPMERKIEYECPRCHHKSGPSDEEREAEISVGRHKIAASVEITNIFEVLAMPWLTSASVSLSFPVTETVVFNFNNGHTFLKLHGGERSFAVYDVTGQPRKWAGDPLYEVLRKYTAFRRSLRKAFSEKFGGELPFEKSEMTPEKYVLMTRFSGFSRNFYDAIPFAEDTHAIDRSFSAVARHLQMPKRAKRLFENSALPKVGAVKRILLWENPGLLFYIRECEALWEVLQDPRLLRFLMQRKCFPDVLTGLHLYPGVARYYRDYAAVTSGKALIGRFVHNLRETNYEAAAYAVMSPFQRKEEQKKWGKEQNPFIDGGSLPAVAQYSAPMNYGDPSIFPCEIDGYRFVWIHTSEEFCTAEEALGFLGNRKDRDEAMVVVWRESEIVAAMEVVNKRMVRASHRDNLEHGEKLKNAVLKWKKKFGVREWHWNEEDPFFEFI